MHSSGFGTTIRFHQIVNAITGHGNPVFHAAEMNLKTFLSQDSADIIAVYRQGQRFHIVGIKEIDKRVNPKMALEYLEMYRHTYDYLYLAAKRFSVGALELKDIGLFDLTRMKVVKNPECLSPDHDFKANLMNRIKNNFKVLANSGEDPFQRSILGF